MKLLEVEGHVPQCPIAGDATEFYRAVRKCEIWPWLSTAVAFEAVWFRNGATFRVIKTYIVAPLATGAMAERVSTNCDSVPCYIGERASCTVPAAAAAASAPAAYHPHPHHSLNRIATTDASTGARRSP